MPGFFIDRPVFAWVVALFICLIGAISIPLLAVAQYPIIAPPSISVSTSFPGASPENLYNSVTRLIEEELNGASGILNFESTSDSLGQVEITANFVPGTDTGSASVEVQNRIKRVEARLPRAVIQQGILVEEASSAVLQIITLRSTDGCGVLLSPTGNALATASAVKTKMKGLSFFFPANIAYDIPYNITPVVKASIEKVLSTLVEAVVLVFIVMFLFLQNIRYTIIPTIVVPVALLGACATLMLAGYSINMLTMFGMVLAVGILVDDAIVVVENVERIMAEEGLPPKEATRKAMSQISGAIIGITLVLMAVFVPMAFFPGSVGIIYRQFSVTMVAAIGFSALLAMSLTPALCATLLKPVAAGHGHAKKGVFGWFNRMLDTIRDRYSRTVRGSLKRTVRLMLIYPALLIVLSSSFIRLPGRILP